MVLIFLYSARVASCLVGRYTQTVAVIPLTLFVLGILLLIKGADWLVDGASGLAKRLGISDLTIGLTVVAFGTSMPELVVSIMSSMQGATDLAIGIVVGSNIANILLILGIASVITPIAVKTSTVWNEIPLALLAALVLMLMANDHIVDKYPVSELSRSDGLSFLAFFVIFLWYIAKLAKRGEMEADDSPHTKRSTIAGTGLLIGGIALLILGGKLTVDGAVFIATSLGLSESLIGLTVVAVGTSLPELATSVTAALKKKADIAVGNIVGSNIFNIFWILGVSAIIQPLRFEPALNVDLAVTVIATVVLFFAVHTGYLHRRLFFWKQREHHIVERADGVLMLVLYAAYIVYLMYRG